MTAEHATTTFAAGAAVSPWWLPQLHTVSAVAAEVLPILGVCWLLFQFGHKLYTIRKRNRE